MKKIVCLGLVIFTVFTLGCSRDSSTDSSKEKAEPPVTKTVLDTKDAMLAKLAGYKISIPEGMVFRSVDKQVYLNKDFEETDTYLVYFDIKYQDKAQKDKLSAWFNDQRTILKNNGWTEKVHEKDKEIMGGGTYDQSVFVKESENCTLDMRLSFTDTVSTLSIHPKYEIK